MRNRSLWAVGSVLVALLAFAGWGGKAQSPARARWEYKVVAEQFGATPPSLSEGRMNQLCAGGWELVDTRVVTIQRGSGVVQYRTDYHFKRAR